MEYGVTSKVDTGRESQVNMALVSLDVSLNRCEQDITALEKRFNSVLRAEPVGPETKGKEGPSVVALAGRLDLFTSRLNKMAQFIESMIERTEL